MTVGPRAAFALVLLATPDLAGGALLRPTALRRPAAQLGCRSSLLRACAAEQPPEQRQRQVRVVVPHSDLMAVTKVAKKKKKGIRSITIGETKIEFAHDMTTSFMWTGILAGAALAKIAKEGKAAWREEPNYKHIARSEEEETELHEFVCEDCGFTMFPARGREGKFFPKNFKCPTCNSPQEAFFDLTDLSDPRTVKALRGWRK